MNRLCRVIPPGTAEPQLDPIHCIVAYGLVFIGVDEWLKCPVKIGVGTPNGH